MNRTILNRIAALDRLRQYMAHPKAPDALSRAAKG
jgi:hypothetical protein